MHDGRRTTDDGQRPVTIAHPEHFVLRWAKKAKSKMFYSAGPNFVSMTDVARCYNNNRENGKNSAGSWYIW